MEINHLNSPPGTYKPIRKNPLDRYRQSTDSSYKWLFPIFFLCWLGLVVYGCNLNPMNSNNQRLILQPIKTWIAEFFTFTAAAVGLVVVICSIFTVLTIVWLRYFTRFCTYIDVISLFIWLILTVIGIGFSIYYLSTGRSDYLPFIFVSLLGEIIYFIYGLTVFVCILKVGIPKIVDIVRITSRAFTSHLLLLPLLLIVVILEAFVVILTLVAILPDSLNPLVQLIIVYIGLYILSVIHNYTRMVISPVFATWHWTEDKSEISSLLIFKHMAQTNRKHLGSLCIASLPIVSSIITLVAVCRQKSHNARKTCLTGWTQFLVTLNLIWNYTEYTTILTSLYGQNFYESTGTTHRLLMKNSTLTLAVFQIFNNILINLIAFLKFLITIIVIFYAKSKSPEYIVGVQSAGLCFVIVILLPVFILFDIVSRAIFLCNLENDEEDSSQDTPE